MEVSNPRLHSQTDALLRVTTSGICGSDLHMYDGRTGLKKGTVVGHEIMGVIEEVGEAVNSIKKGDRVVLPFNVACGFCFNCHRGHTEACLTSNPQAPHAAYELRTKNRGIQQSLRPGEEKMKGVDCAIDAVGYQAHSDDNPKQEKATQVLDNVIRVVNPTGCVELSAFTLLRTRAPRVKKRRKAPIRSPSLTISIKASPWEAGRRR